MLLLAAVCLLAGSAVAESSQSQHTYPTSRSCAASRSRTALRPELKRGAATSVRSAGPSADSHHAGRLEPRCKELARTLVLQGGSSSSGSSLSSPALYAHLKLGAAFAGWYCMSIVYSLLNKELLNVWNFPCTSAAVQLLVGGLWIFLLWLPVPVPGRAAPLRARRPPSLSRTELGNLGAVSFFLAFGHLLSTVAPAYGTVAFTNVVKTLEPLFTCILAAVLLGQTFSPAVYLSLLPVIAGVLLATASELSFSSISLVSGLLSNLMFALRAISAKRVMQGSMGVNLTAQNLYAVLTLQALLLLLPVALLFEGRSLGDGTAVAISQVGTPRFCRMLLTLGLSHYMYNECAFLALSSVHPVTHAVANTVKRVAVIVISVLYFRDPLTKSGAAGSGIALAGVMVYSLSKARWEQAQKKQASK